MQTEAASVPVHELITNYRAATVPLYQRSYKWDLEELEEFWTDINGIMTGTDTNYFLGSIVLIKKNHAGDVEIVDGQQRITTLSLGLCAFRDGCKGVKDNERAQLLTEYLGKTDFKTLKLTPKLTLNEENDGLYQQILNSELNLADLRKYTKDRSKSLSNRRLAAAYILSYEKLESLTKSFRDIDQLESCRSALVERLEVVRILSPDDVSAYVLFETLNDRGADLALADLLKNYVFMKADKRIGEAKAAWTELSVLVGRESLTQYIRHHWMSHNGLIRERDLYRKLKGRLSDEKKTIAYLDELKADAQIYVEIGNIHSSTWSGYSAKAKRSLRAIQIFGIKQCYPLILACHGLKNADRDLILEWIAALLFRYTLVGEKGTGNLETLYARASVEARTKPFKRSEVKKLFLELYPKDDEFEASFAERTFSRPELVKYVLSCLENFRSGKDEITVDTENVTVEHILPKNPVSGWGVSFQKGKPNHTTYLKRLGNLTLLTAPMNDEVANEVFSIKKPVYATSSLSITKDLALLSRWSTVEIDERQINLGKSALVIWRIV